MPELVDESLARACVDLARTMARSGDPEAVLRCLVEREEATIGDAAATVVLTDPAGELSRLAGTNPSRSRTVAAELDLREGPSLDALLTGAVVSADDLDDEERWPSYRRNARSAGIRSVLAVPLVVGERSVGVITLVGTGARHWHEREIAAATALADLVSSHLGHATELAEVRRTAEQLQTALESRVEIELAKGILVGELGCSVDHAFAMLRRHARTNNASLHEVARAVVHLGLRPPRDHPHGKEER